MSSTLKMTTIVVVLPATQTVKKLTVLPDVSQAAQFRIIIANWQ
jgi:hypothetical protein